MSFLYAWLLTIGIIYACLFLQLALSIYVFVYTKRGVCMFIFLFCIWIDKMGEKRILRFYICMSIFSIGIRAYMFCLCKRGRSILIYVYLCWAFIAYLYIYCYAWVNGELLWSLTLIHAYLTPWVLSSSKKGRCWPRGPSL